MNAGIPKSVAAAIDRLRLAVDKAGLARAMRRKVALAVHRLIVSKRTPGTPGKRRDRRIDRAHAQYKAGVRGVKLFRRFIVGYKHLAAWRRGLEQRRLMAAIHQRASREKKNAGSEGRRKSTSRRPILKPPEEAPEGQGQGLRAPKLTITDPQLSGTQLPTRNCQIDSGA